MSCGDGCTCGCCAGLAAVTPVAVENRPGLPALRYRVGTYADFRETLFARISQSHQPVLSALSTRDDDDFTIALFDSFSVMADVLTFYSERYANEAYLRTATERFSVRQLAALVGYRPSPGVAASTYLAFNIDAAAGAYGAALVGPVPGQNVPLDSQTPGIPPGTGVQSIPSTPQELPQSFETTVPSVANPQWNAITPQLTQPQTIQGDTPAIVTSLQLTGTITSLKPGDSILLLHDNAPANFTKIRTVLRVSPATDGKTTLVELDGAVSGTSGYNPRSAPTLQGAINGSIDGISAIDLTDAAVAAVLQNTWDQGTLAALAQIRKWPLGQLEAAINQQVAQRAGSSGGKAYVLRQQAAPFGFNIPIQTYPNTSPAIPSNDPVNGAGIGSTNVIYLDAPYPGIAADSFAVVMDSTDRLCVSVASAPVTTVNQFKISGKVSALQLNATADFSKYPVRSTTILCQSEELPLAPVPITDGVASGTTQIVLSRAFLGLQAGQEVAIFGSRTDLPGVSACEVRRLQAVVLNSGYTVITLDSGLTYAYTRGSLSINANLAYATHGASVAETLGSGDATTPFQSFGLKQSPLTYVPAANAAGISSTLQVWVDNERWSEADTFYAHGPQEHIYVTAQDDAGNTTVTFGDGISGARLPTGTANLRAQYRYGIGVAGMVNTNQIVLLTSRPLGVRSAFNPVPAVGGVDPEGLDDARDNATLTIKALERVVSIDDFQSFARAYTGIHKASATWIWMADARWCC